MRVGGSCCVWDVLLTGQWTEAGAMYRTLLPILVLTIAVAAAPQDPANSDITYVKIKPVTEDSAPPTHLFRESRIENLPLTIPGNVTSRIEDRNPIIKSPVKSTSVEQKNPTKRESNSARTFVNEKEILNDDDSQDISDDTNNSRQIRSEDSTASYESETVEPTEANTESVEELTQKIEEYEARTKAPSPRFLSKLSYFKKEDEVRSSIATNLVERVGKRKFKSKCRCEKIWNCGSGKLQITVPRCPNEYFLCCF